MSLRSAFARSAVVGALMCAALFVAVTSPAAAHNMEITNPQTGEVVKEQWIGGPPVPADADPMFGLFKLPPSHGTGLVKACAGTATSPTASIKAPPSYTGCQHGQ